MPPAPLPVLPRSANEFIQQQLDERIKTIEDVYTAHAIGFAGPILFGVDDVIRIAVEQRHSQPPARRKLVVLLTTTGGSLRLCNES